METHTLDEHTTAQETAPEHVGALTISVIVPAYNAAEYLPACLDGIAAAGLPSDCVVVVDDGSTDDTPAIARAAGARLVQLPGNTGAGLARNAGVAEANGDILLFVDADVVLAPDAPEVLREFFKSHPDYAAVFGAYDDDPADPSPVSRIRNLLHRWVHVTNAGEAFTFWTGCGAVRAADFRAIGGFSPDHRLMEDIHLGMALTAAGRRIRILPALQGKHLKRWTFASMARTDLFARAIPWARLLRQTRGERPPHGLNTNLTGKISVAAVAASLLALPALVVAPLFALSAMLVALGVMIWANRHFIARLWTDEGPTTALVAGPVLWVHYFCGGLGFAWVIVRG